MAMAFTLALAQCSHPTDGDVVGMADRWTREARRRDADLVVFPESLMTPFELDEAGFKDAAEPLDGPFGRAMGEIAREQGLWMIFTMNERNPAGGAPFNTAVVLDDAGRRRGVYRKVHLFDVGDYRESAKMSAGASIFEPLRTPFCTLGLGICYDLRFPELARVQALSGCELLVYPSAWVKGEDKLGQWRTLIRARAIEDGMFVAGLSRTGGVYLGHSFVAGPTGRALAEADEREQLLCCRIDPDEVAETRSSVPSLRHRRPELY